MFRDLRIIINYIMITNYLQIFAILASIASFVLGLKFQNKTSFTTEIDISKIVYSPDQKFIFVGGGNNNIYTTFLLYNGLKQTLF